MELYNSSKYMRYLIHLFHDGPLAPVTDDLHPFHCNESALHHLLQLRHKGFQPLGLVYDFHDDRQINGKSQDMCVMEMTRSPEAHRAAQHGSTGNIKFPRSQHDRLVQRAMHIFIRLSKEYSQKRALFGKISGLRGDSWLFETVMGVFRDHSATLWASAALLGRAADRVLPRVRA